MPNQRSQASSHRPPRGLPSWCPKQGWASIPYEEEGAWFGCRAPVLMEGGGGSPSPLTAMRNCLLLIHPSYLLSYRYIPPRELDQFGKSPLTVGPPHLPPLVACVCIWCGSGPPQCDRHPVLQQVQAHGLPGLPVDLPLDAGLLRGRQLQRRCEEEEERQIDR